MYIHHKRQYGNAGLQNRSFVTQNTWDAATLQKLFLGAKEKKCLQKVREKVFGTSEFIEWRFLNSLTALEGVFQLKESDSKIIPG